MRLINADDLLTAFPTDDEPMITKSTVRMTIQRMPTIEPEWIPVSERLPEAWKPVLVTDIKGNVNMLKWSHKEYWVDCYKEEFYGYKDWVIAWMPSPEHARMVIQNEHDK